MRLTRSAPDRTATPNELRAARRAVLACDGLRLAEAAKRLGLSSSYLSELLRGKRPRQLTLGELRRIRVRRRGSSPSAGDTGDDRAQ